MFSFHRAAILIIGVSSCSVKVERFSDQGCSSHVSAGTTACGGCDANKITYACVGGKTKQTQYNEKGCTGSVKTSKTYVSGQCYKLGTDFYVHVSCSSTLNSSADQGAFALIGVAAADPTFDEWAADYGFNSADDTLRTKYEGNLAEIARLREEHPEAEFGVNQFSGMTFKEFSEQMLTLRDDPLANSDVPLLEGSDLTELATDVDWDVTPVKNQGSCGSCWAFSTMASIEHGHKLKTGASVNLAEQQLVDCDKTSNGCSGGMTYTAMNFLSGKAIYTTSSYAYTGRDGTCKTASDSGVRISGYVGLAKSESALLTGLNTQAVSVIVYADSTFQSYKSGVINAPTTCNLNHGVLATGYTSDYIKIKNSWGTGWGEAGYIRVKRTTSGCGPYGLYYSTNSYPKGTTEAVEV